MKLYPIIFTEAARTVEGSLEKGIFAFQSKGFQNRIALFSLRRLLAAFKTTTKKLGHGYDPSKILYENDFLKEVIKRASNSAVVGQVTYTQTKYDDAYKVNTSGGVSSFGPLAYQIAMYAISPSWLMSDTSLKPASHRVWMKMFELSGPDGGQIYERKFLGEYGIEELFKRFSGANPNYYGPFTRYIEAIENKNKKPTEEEFLNWVRSIGAEPREFGQMWAYRKIDHDPAIEQMFVGAENFIEKAIQEFGLTKEAAETVLNRSASDFFTRLYGGTSSY